MRQLILHVKPFLSTKFLFSKISFFQNFVSFYLILFYLIKNFFSKFFCDEHYPNSDLETVMSPKTRSKLSQVHRAPNLAHPAHTGALKGTRAWPCCRPLRPCRRRPNAVSQGAMLCRRRCAAHLAVVSQTCGHVTRHSPAGQAPHVTIQ